MDGMDGMDPEKGPSQGKTFLPGLGQEERKGVRAIWSLPKSVHTIHTFHT